LNDNYFPTSGLQIQLEGGAYYGWGHFTDDDGDTFRYNERFYEAQFDLKAAIPLGRRVALIPQMWNRWLLGGTPFSFYKNYVGGSMYGRYTQTQIPFIGINHVYLTYSRLDIARLDLRVNLFKQHYATLYANYMFEWDKFGSDYALDRHLGLGVGYSLNTIIGPIQLIAHWSNLSRRVGVYFSLGYDF
jgi:NTE family protein